MADILSQPYGTAQTSSRSFNCPLRPFPIQNQYPVARRRSPPAPMGPFSSSGQELRPPCTAADRAIPSPRSGKPRELHHITLTGWTTGRLGKWHCSGGRQAGWRALSHHSCDSALLVCSESQAAKTENVKTYSRLLICHQTEPVSSGAPKVPTGAQGSTFYFRANSAATLHCTGQGFPVPTFR